ncbi:MAG: single-stranded-DNA-specific exonuclease RecJ [Idiomarina sp.]
MTADYVVKRYPQLPDDHLPSQLHPLIRQIYARRGVKSADELELKAARLTHFDQLHGSRAAAQLLASAIEKQQSICICGDFDADGATSTALMVSALQAFGAQQVHYLVPNRFADGYGLSESVVKQAQALGSELLITVDNGISCHAGVQAAKDAGMQVIVTDHHLPGHELPNADVIVNPNHPDCHFPSKNLAGVGVAFYLLLALRNVLREQGQQALPNLADWLDLVAVGTVADVVQLDGNNRILVQQGLQRIRAGACRPGIQALLQVAGREAAKLQASDLGFTVGPRINAAGRLDDMGLGIECLLTQSYPAALDMANKLDSLNRERRSIETEMREEAEVYVAGFAEDSGALPPLITLFEANWHQGVIGIVAGRVKEQCHRPVIAFAEVGDGELKGSARSIPGLHIRDLLERIHSLHPGMITRFGGHAMAAGLTLPIAQLSAFRKVAAEVAASHLSEAQLTRTLWSDGGLGATELHESFVQQLQQAGPWGQGFSEPLFDDEFRLVNQRIVGERHLKMVLQTADNISIDAISFNVDTALWPNLACERIHCIYKPQLNTFRGRTTVQLLVEHFSALR